MYRISYSVVYSPAPEGQPNRPQVGTVTFYMKVGKWVGIAYPPKFVDIEEHFREIRSKIDKNIIDFTLTSCQVAFYDEDTSTKIFLP